MREAAPMWKRILLAMREREGMTAQEIEAASGVSVHSVRPYLSMFMSSGLVWKEKRTRCVMWFRSVSLAEVEVASTMNALRPERGEGTP